MLKNLIPAQKIWISRIFVKGTYKWRDGDWVEGIKPLSRINVKNS